MNKAADKVERFLASASKRMGKGKKPKEVKSNITDNESAKMTTSKGTIQGYSGVGTVDKKHQIIVYATAFGEGQEHHALQPVLKKVAARYRRLDINSDILKDIIVTADTGFANEANMTYLHENKINGYIPENQFRSRDPKFQDRKTKHPQWTRQNRKPTNQFPASVFNFDPVSKTCQFPAEEDMWLKKEGIDARGNLKLFFEGRISKCRDCPLKKTCMRNPDSADTRKGQT
ncbi:MAG: transposase [Pseudomonadales bacterium]|nr:transposase [Pseudomonadales bacterium]